MQPISLKRRLASWLQRFPPLRWGLMLAVKLLVPQHHVGAVGVIFNNAGQVLLVEHVFRPYYPWGLPGGWVERGEDPADTVQREIEEELQLQVEVKRLVLCKPQGTARGDGVPLGLGLAFYCRLAGDQPRPGPAKTPGHAYEVLSTAWVDPENITWKLAPLEQIAIALAKKEFDHDVPGA